MVKYAKLTKAEVLAALYNNAKSLGIGIFIRENKNMTIEEAERLLKINTSFDYIKGRVLKVDLSGDDGFDEWLYDRDNGKGAAQNALDTYFLEKNNINNI